MITYDMGACFERVNLPQVRAQDAVTDFVVWTESDTLDARLLACACLVMSASCVAVEQTTAVGVPAQRTPTLQRAGVPTPGVEVLGQATCAFLPTAKDDAAKNPTDAVQNLEKQVLAASGVQRADFCAYVVQFADAGLVRAVTGGDADLDTKVRDWMQASGCVGVWAEQAVP